MRAWAARRSHAAHRPLAERADVLAGDAGRRRLEREALLALLAPARAYPHRSVVCRHPRRGTGISPCTRHSICHSHLQLPAASAILDSDTTRPDVTVLSVKRKKQRTGVGGEGRRVAEKRRAARMFAVLALSARDYKKLTTLEPLDTGDVPVLRRGWLLRALVTRPELAAALACCARLRCRGVRGGI